MPKEDEMEKKVKASDFENIPMLEDVYASLDKSLIPRTMEQVMEIKGLTREEVAKLSHIPFSTINAYFDNKADILYGKRCKICSVLGYEYDEMVALAAFFQGKLTSRGLDKVDDILSRISDVDELLYVDLFVQQILGHI